MNIEKKRFLIKTYSMTTQELYKMSINDIEIYIDELEDSVKELKEKVNELENKLESHSD